MAMEYDPTQNPRWLGQTAEFTVPDPERIEELEQRIAAWREALEVFAMPGWAHIAATASADAAALEKQLLSDHIQEPGVIGSLRGQIRALRTVAEFPEKFQQQLEDDAAELAAAERPEAQTEEPAGLQ